MWVTSSLTNVLTPTAVALGNFDGVHLGHQRVIEPVLRSDNGPEIVTPRHTTVVTFNPHPREFFTGESKALLTPTAEKAAQLAELGVDQLVLLPFDRELADLSPDQFVHSILVERLQVQQVSVGMDFRFGHQRAGTAADLQRLAAPYGIAVTVVPLQISQGERVSSSAIRQALLQGEVRTAARLLGRPYSLAGQVVQGQQLGRTLGFPTANLQVPAEKLLPRAGVYCVRVRLSSNASPTREAVAAESTGLWPGVMNIGYRPTVNGTAQTIEVHLLDWEGDLYGQTLSVMLEEFLRPEQKFASIDDLRTQIEADCLVARKILMAAT